MDDAEVPNTVTLQPDGFQVEIGGRRAEERALAIVVSFLGTAMLAALAFGATTASIHEMLGLAVWALIGVLGLLGLQIAYVVVAPVRRTPVSLSGFTLRLGTRRIAIEDITEVAIRGGHLVVDAGHRHIVPASHVSGHVRRWVCDRIAERREAWRGRDGSAPPEIEALRGR